MTTQRKIEANRRNGSRSTGPKTPAGLARSSRNAAKHSLYTDAVVPALGESPHEFEALHRGLRAELRPGGALEERMVLRLATLLWRFDRLTRYETAAARAAVAAEPPPDPDAVTGRGADPDRPVPPDATPAQKLAHLRGVIDRSAAELPALRLAARLLGGGDGSAAAVAPAWHEVVAEVGRALGCTREEAMQRLGEADEATGSSTGEGLTGAVLRGLVAYVADDDGFDPDAVTRSVRDGLAARAEAEGLVARWRAEEEGLVARMRLAREGAAAAAAFGDEAVLDRVLRVEAHLTRQLEATLALLARVRGEGACRVVGGLGVLVREVASRVGAIGTGEPAALPEAVGSCRNCGVRAGRRGEAVPGPVREAGGEVGSEADRG